MAATKIQIVLFIYIYLIDLNQVLISKLNVSLSSLKIIEIRNCMFRVNY